MRYLILSTALSFTSLALHAQTGASSPNENAAAIPTPAEGPAKEAMEAFQSGRHARAIALATPIAETGNAEALHLLGFAYESGKGVQTSKEKALEYYRKAANINYKDSMYRMSFILLASEKEEEREEAKKILENAAKNDPAVAGRILGEAYLRGRLTPAPDPDKAIFWWKRAAETNDVASIILVAKFYEGQLGFPELKNSKEAIDYYTKAANLGNPGAMAAVGSRLLSGEEKIRDEKKGRLWLNKAINEKEYASYLALGDYEETVKKDLKAALAEYERGKDVGQMDCMIRTADFYIEGKGVAKDLTRGLALLNKAAEAGNPTANFRLAVRALSMEKPDLLTGYGHMLAAANGNLPEAQNELGLLYLSGKLSVADSSAGVAWLTRAAQNGFAQAQHNLGTLYERGAGVVQQNIENAGQYYSLAAAQGHGPATLALARLINEGIGTKPDPIKAWTLANLAMERGDKNAEALVNEITKKFDEKELIAAKKDLENFKAGKTNSPKAPNPTTPPPKAAPVK